MHKPRSLRRSICTLGLTAALAAGCGTTSSTRTDAAVDTSSDTPAVASGPVVEIAIRRLGASQDVTAFASARDAFVTQLRAQPGVTVDREFQSFFDFTANGPPVPPVYIGMTQYASLDAFQRAGAALGSSSQAMSFFSTFTPSTFTVLRPLNPSATVDLGQIANQSGQVLEVAVRDLSTYASFDAAAYASARDAFIALLVAQPGVVAEYQWVSALNPNLAVGMTVYRDQAAFLAIAQSDAVTGSPAAAAFLTRYPPRSGFVNTVVR